jgi:hypothetical protein
MRARAWATSAGTAPRRSPVDCTKSEANTNTKEQHREEPACRTHPGTPIPAKLPNGGINSHASSSQAESRCTDGVGRIDGVGRMAALPPARRCGTLRCLGAGLPQPPRCSGSPGCRALWANRLRARIPFPSSRLVRAVRMGDLGRAWAARPRALPSPRADPLGPGPGLRPISDERLHRLRVRSRGCQDHAGSCIAQSNTAPVGRAPGCSAWTPCLEGSRGIGCCCLVWSAEEGPACIQRTNGRQRSGEVRGGSGALPRGIASHNNSPSCETGTRHQVIKSEWRPPSKSSRPPLCQGGVRLNGVRYRHTHTGASEWVTLGGWGGCRDGWGGCRVLGDGGERCDMVRVLRTAATSTHGPTERNGGWVTRPHGIRIWRRPLSVPPCHTSDPPPPTFLSTRTHDHAAIKPNHALSRKELQRGKARGTTHGMAPHAPYSPPHNDSTRILANTWCGHRVGAPAISKSGEWRRRSARPPCGRTFKLHTRTGHTRLYEERSKHQHEGATQGRTCLPRPSWDTHPNRTTQQEIKQSRAAPCGLPRPCSALSPPFPPPPASSRASLVLPPSPPARPPLRPP